MASRAVVMHTGQTICKAHRDHISDRIKGHRLCQEQLVPASGRTCWRAALCTLVPDAQWQPRVFCLVPFAHAQEQNVQAHNLPSLPRAEGLLATCVCRPSASVVCAPGEPLPGTVLPVPCHSSTPPTFKCGRDRSAVGFWVVRVPYTNEAGKGVAERPSGFDIERLWVNARQPGS